MRKYFILCEALKRVDIADIIKYAKELNGTPYRWWDGNTWSGDKPPFWAVNKPAPNPNKVSYTNCAGFINLIARKAGRKIPGVDDNRPYPGGTGEWADDKSITYKKFNPKGKYKPGTLLIRPWKGTFSDQGHLALIIDNNKVIHGTSDDVQVHTISEAIKYLNTIHKSMDSKWKNKYPYFELYAEPNNWLL